MDTLIISVYADRRGGGGVNLLIYSSGFTGVLCAVRSLIVSPHKTDALRMGSTNTTCHRGLFYGLWRRLVVRGEG